MSEKPPPIVELYRNLAGLMMEERPSALEKLTGPFPIRYLVTANGEVLQADEHKIVKRTTREIIAGSVQKFIDLHAHELGQGYCWTAKQAEAFVDYWAYLAPEIPMPLPWAWPGDDRYAFHQIPFSPTPGPTPLWDELLGRMDNAEAFRLWVGGLFFEGADRQTYVWLYGEGQNGKGVILRSLEKTFGSAYKADQVPDHADKFWSYWLLGKRLVAFADTNNAGFCASGNFKSLTGGDKVRMEIKKGASFCADLMCLFIFASNERPRLSSEKADMRRAILCEIEPIVGDAQVDYKDRLWSEMPAFVASAMAAYEKRGSGPILADQRSLDRWVGSLEDRYEAILEDHFVVYDEKELDGVPFISGPHMTKMLHAVLKDRTVVQEFYKYLERKKNIKRKRVQMGKDRVNGYMRINFKDPAFHQVRNYTGKEIVNDSE